MEKSKSLLMCFAYVSLFTLGTVIFLWLRAERSVGYSEVKVKDILSIDGKSTPHFSVPSSALNSSSLNQNKSTASLRVTSNVPPTLGSNSANPTNAPPTPHIHSSISQATTESTKQQNIPTDSLKSIVGKDDPRSYYWRIIDNSKNVQMKLFSAYYDDRESPDVYLLGFEDHTSNQKYYCAFVYDDDKHACSKEPAERIQTNYDVDPVKEFKIVFWAFYYVCKLPTSEIPQRASLSLRPDCTLNSDKDWLPVQNRVKREPSQMIKFGACVEAPIYDIDDPQRVVEYIELQRAMGAELITVYIQRAGKLVWKVLEQYAKEGLVDLMNWDLTFLPGSGYLHYRGNGQSLMVNECVYRNMYRVKYLAMNDLDEIILPQGSLHTWSDLLASIDSGENKHGAFSFIHTAFTRDHKPIKEELLRCPPELGSTLKAINPPRYMAKTKRWMKSGYRKYIVKPMFGKKVSFHDVPQFVNGYTEYHVPKDLAMSYHYREPPFPGGYGASVDDRLQTLFPDLFEKIKQRVCATYIE